MDGTQGLKLKMEIAMSDFFIKEKGGTSQNWAVISLYHTKCKMSHDTLQVQYLACHASKVLMSVHNHDSFGFGVEQRKID